MIIDFFKKIKLPALLLAVLIFPLIFGPYVPQAIKSVSYALSLSIKNVLEFLLRLLFLALFFLV